MNPFKINLILSLLFSFVRLYTIQVDAPVRNELSCFDRIVCWHSDSSNNLGGFDVNQHIINRGFFIHNGLFHGVGNVVALPYGQVAGNLNV